MLPVCDDVVVAENSCKFLAIYRFQSNANLKQYL